MSVDYTIEVRRKKDDKIIGKFLANCIKTILDSNLSDYIHCNGRIDSENTLFTIDDIVNVDKIATEKLRQCFKDIENNNLKLNIVDKISIRNEIKEDNEYLEEKIDVYLDVIRSANILYGMISEVTEDDVKIDSNSDIYEVAYRYNIQDISRDKEDISSTIWNSDVYCKLLADY